MWFGGGAGGVDLRKCEFININILDKKMFEEHFPEGFFSRRAPHAIAQQDLTGENSDTSALSSFHDQVKKQTFENFHLLLLLAATSASHSGENTAGS
jgi:hypothetical protein